jgi:hypothetical protein
MLARVAFTGGSGRWALGWSHFRFGVDLLGGDIDSLHTDSGDFEVDSRGNANQHSSACPRSLEHSQDASQVADDAANAPTDANVNHTRVGISERTRQAIFSRFCHAVLQVPQQRSPSDEFRGPTEAGDSLGISILRWNKTLWSERACLHFSSIYPQLLMCQWVGWFGRMSRLFTIQEMVTSRFPGSPPTTRRLGVVPRKL